MFSVGLGTFSSSSMSPRKPAQHDWNLQNCRRMNLQLPPDEPVRLFYQSHPRREALSFDMHCELELGIVAKGRILRRYQESEMSVAAGQVWLCGLWEAHAAWVTRAPCEVAVFIIRPQFLCDLSFEEWPGLNWMAPFALPSSQRPQVGIADRAAATALASRAQGVCGLPGGAERRLRARLLLLETLLLLHHRLAPSSLGRLPPETLRRVDQAIQLVLNSARPVDTAEAARACAMSRSHFDRLFTRVMGLSFARFELRRRLQGAAQQLLESKAPLKAVATAWGFVDASHLSRRFRDYYRCSPLEYCARTPA